MGWSGAHFHPWADKLQKLKYGKQCEIVCTYPLLFRITIMRSDIDCRVELGFLVPTLYFRSWDLLKGECKQLCAG